MLAHAVSLVSLLLFFIFSLYFFDTVLLDVMQKR